MSWSIFLFPLLGGYLYLTRCIKTKHLYKRLERQRLVFDSTIKGFYFLIASFVLGTSIKLLFPEFVPFLTPFFFNTPFFYTFLLSFFIAFAWTEGFNLLKPKLTENIENWYLAKAILKTGNSMQQDLLKSYINEELLMFTLRNGKVYVGLAIELSEPDGQSYIRILPFYSGYRTTELDVRLVTDYISVYKDLLDKNKDDSEISTETVICEDDIITTTFFKQEVFDRAQVSD